MPPSSSVTGVEPLSEAEIFRFSVPGRLEYRDAARVFLAYVCDQLVQRGDFPKDIGHRVISAFVEAFTNAVLHGYRDREPGPVEVDMEVRPSCLRVVVVDYGQSFQPDLVPEPDLDALPEGGLGLFIIRNFMDEVTFERVDQRNILTMEKRFGPSSDEALKTPEL